MRIEVTLTPETAEGIVDDMEAGQISSHTASFLNTMLYTVRRKLDSIDNETEQIRQILEARETRKQENRK
jgi:hypothetical protein